MIIVIFMIIIIDVIVIVITLFVRVKCQNAQDLGVAGMHVVNAVSNIVSFKM
jgi:hypothetical protein